MYGKDDLIKEDINNVLGVSGFSPNEFKITIETGTSYEPHQIVATQVWITIEKSSKTKKYGLPCLRRVSTHRLHG